MPKSNAQRLLDALEELGGIAAPEQMTFELGWSSRAIGHMITRLAQRGLVKRREHRVLYEITGRALSRNIISKIVSRGETIQRNVKRDAADAP